MTDRACTGETLFHKNDLVVDLFVGSGAVAVAAKRLNRRFVGADTDKDTINTCLFRLAQEVDLK